MMRRGTNPQGIRTGIYRSKFEAKIAEQLNAGGVRFAYETLKVGFTQERLYTPDFVLNINGNMRVIEAKGWFKPSDRTKLLAVKKTHPELDLRLIFQRASTKLTKAKGGKTYAEWAKANGIPWAEGSVPQGWLK